MSSHDEKFDRAFKQLATDVVSALAMEHALNGKGPLKLHKNRGRSKKHCASDLYSDPFDVEPRDPVEIARAVLSACNRKRKESADVKELLVSDDALSKMARFTDKFKLKPFERFLHYVPRLVNVVTLAEAIPVPGSGVSLPLDLHRIAARCRNAYYAPKKFSAVQLAYSEPRCRVLVFHTGRIVGTGTGGPVAARIALLLAQRQLYKDAGVHIHVQNFSVINQVGAFNLRATLNCEAFATEHSSTAHFDVKSFVGLAWRPAGEPICCEIYGTGRANLPGSVVERQLQDSLSRMFPELLRFSSSSRLLELVPEELKVAHRPSVVSGGPMVASMQQTRTSRFMEELDNRKAHSGDAQAPHAYVADVWDGWGDGADTEGVGSSCEHAKGFAFNADVDASDDDLDLTEMGL